MKKIKTLLALVILSLSLMSCNNNNQDTSTSNTQLDNFDSASLAIMEQYLDGYTIPYYAELFQSSVTTNSSSSQIVTSNYTVYYNSLTDMVVLTYMTDYIENVDNYYNYVMTTYSNLYVVDETLNDASNHDYYIYQQISDTSSVNSRFYLNIYYDLGNVLTIDAYIESIYTLTQWPTSEEETLISDYLYLPRQYASYFEFSPLGMRSMTLQLSTSYITGLPLVALMIYTNNQNSLDDFISQLEAKGYINDLDNSMNSLSNYYQIITENDTPLYSFECYIDDTINSLDNNLYSYRVNFTYNV